MPIAVETLRVALRGAEHAFPIVTLTDRRKKPARRKAFALVRGIEQVLYGVTTRSTGAFWAHLAKHDHEEAVLVADRAAVDAGVLTDAELAAGARALPLRRPRLAHRPWPHPGRARSARRHAPARRPGGALARPPRLARAD